MTDTTCPIKPKIFTIYPFIEKIDLLIFALEHCLAHILKTHIEWKKSGTEWARTGSKEPSMQILVPALCDFGPDTHLLCVSVTL